MLVVSLLWLVALLCVAVVALLFTVRSRQNTSQSVAAGHACPPWFVFQWLMPALSWLGIHVPNVCAPPQFRVMELASMFALSRAIHVAADWGIADQIQTAIAKDPAKARSGVSVEELAKLNSCDADKLARVLAHCVNYGVFAEQGGRGTRRYINNALSETLRSDSPVTTRDIVRVIGFSAYPGLGELEYGLRSKADDPTPFARANGGRGVWDLFESDPNKRAVFASGMTAIDSFSLQAIVDDFPWAQRLGAQGQQAGRLVDVAGSLGSVLKNVLRLVPNARGVLFDLPSVVPLAEKVWSRDNRDLLERVQFVGGSFFDAGSIPAAQGSNDLYMLRNILHDWNDEQSLRILRTVREAIGNSGAKLVIVEMIPREPVDPMAAVKSFMDLNMLAVCDGKERSVERHWRPLLDAAQFRIAAVTDTRSEYRVLEAEAI